MKTRQQLAAEAGVTEAQLDAVEDALDALDPVLRAAVLKAMPEIERIARENNITLDDLCRGVTRYRQSNKWDKVGGASHGKPAA
jgi:hypothetical protein